MYGPFFPITTIRKSKWKLRCQNLVNNFICWIWRSIWCSYWAVRHLCWQYSIPIHMLFFMFVFMRYYFFSSFWRCWKNDIQTMVLISTTSLISTLFLFQSIIMLTNYQFHLCESIFILFIVLTPLAILLICLIVYIIKGSV